MLQLDLCHSCKRTMLGAGRECPECFGRMDGNLEGRVPSFCPHCRNVVMFHAGNDKCPRCEETSAESDVVRCYCARKYTARNHQYCPRCLEKRSALTPRLTNVRVVSGEVPCAL